MNKIMLIILTVLLFGVSVFFRKLAVDKIHPYQLQIVAGLVYAVEIPIWLYLLHRNQISGYHNAGVIYGVICIVTYVLGAVLFGYLLRSSNQTGLVSILISLNPFVTLLLSILFLQEELTIKNVIASGLALGSLILFSWK